MKLDFVHYGEPSIIFQGKKIPPKQIRCVKTKSYLAIHLYKLNFIKISPTVCLILWYIHTHY